MRREAVSPVATATDFESYLRNLRNPFGHYRTSLAQLADRYKPGLVSIIIPCFNNGPYVRQAIDSALGQSLDASEIIVINDGSTDDSLDVITSYGSRIVWRSKENAGANAARNDGLELAQGEFIQFLDADDALVNGGIKARLAAFEANVDAVFGDRDWIDHDGARTGRSRRYAELGWPPTDIPAFLCDHTSIGTPDVLHRRSHLYTEGGFDEALPRLQDTEFHLRLYFSGHKFKHIPEKVSLARAHQSENRITNTKFYSVDREQLGKVAYCFLAVAKKKASGSIGIRFREVVAFLIEKNCRIAVQHGDYLIALKLIRNAQYVLPSGPAMYVHHLGRLHRIAVRSMGYWPALRLWAFWKSLLGCLK